MSVKCILTGQSGRGSNKGMILKDEITGAKYNLIAENGTLVLQEITPAANETEIQLIDIITGRTYKLIVEGSILKLEEV